MTSTTNYKSRLAKEIVILAICVMGGALLAGRALALTISTPIFDISADPGENVTETLKIFNESDNWATLYASTADFSAKDSEEGIPEFLPVQEGDNSLANWIEVSKDPVTILPSEQKNIQFTIHVPRNADPGGHYAAVFFGTQPGDASGSSVGLSSKLGALVLLTVSGDINEAGSLKEFKLQDPKPFYDHLPVWFSILFENSGNVHLKPQGEIKITNWLGWGSDKVLVNKEEMMGGKNILPGTSRHLEAMWTLGPIQVKDNGFLDKLKNEAGNFALGRYKASLNLGYGTQGKTVNANLIFWVFPWHLILVFVLSAAILIFLAIKTIRGYNRWIVKRASKKINSNDKAQ